MTDEEKKKLEKVIYDNNYLFCDKRDVDFLLNLIEKQQREIETSNNIKLKALKRVSELESENEQLRTLLDSKDKMIREWIKINYN